MFIGHDRPSSAAATIHDTINFSNDYCFLIPISFVRQRTQTELLLYVQLFQSFHSTNHSHLIINFWSDLPFTIQFRNTNTTKTETEADEKRNRNEIMTQTQ